MADQMIDKHELEAGTVIPEKLALRELQDAVLNSIEKLQVVDGAESKVDDMDHSKPGPLTSRGHDLAAIIDMLEDFLMYDDAGPCKGPISLPVLDAASKAAIIAHCLAAFITKLDRPHLHKVASRITSDTTLWISRLFRLFDCSACFHEEPWDGLVRLCRTLLRLRYPKYEEDGYETLYSRPPIIYVSAAIRSGLGQYLCTKNVAELERTVEEDIAAQKTPLLVIASAGALPLGQVDNLQRFQEICKTHELWLHIEGHGLAALCLVPTPTLPAKVGDSMTLPIGSWLGLTSVPHVTLYKTLDPSATVPSGLTASTPHQKLSSLPVWVALQSLGHDGVINRIQHAFQLVRHLQEKLTMVSNVRLVGRQQPDKNNSSYSVNDLTTKAVSASVLFEILSPAVIFQYTGIGKTVPNNDAPSQAPFNHCSDAYFSSLNSWLGQILQRDIPAVHTDIIELDSRDVCIRFCPLDGSGNASNVTVEVLDFFVSCLSQQVDILNATVRHKEAFPGLIDKHSNLQQVELSDWAGLGGVRYIPDAWVNNLTDLSDAAKEDINKINYELVAQLKNTDSAFSMGEGDDGLYCVRFGMVTEDTEMEELLDLVVDTGNEIEESSKYLESMSEIIKKGIEKANEDLKKENDDKIWQDGILRHVPVVSNIFNWWAPLSKETGVKGRSFNLSSGVIESTENIYKYHMQIQQGSQNSAPATPKPVIQTPIVVPTEHSRSSSKGSINHFQEESPTSDPVRIEGNELTTNDVNAAPLNRT